MDHADRLFELLRAAGVPARTVRAEGTGFALTFEAGATPDAQRQAYALVDTFDASETAHDAWLAARRKAEAKVWLENPEALARLVRAVLIYLLQQIQVAVPGYAMPTKAEVKAAIKAIADGAGAD